MITIILMCLAVFGIGLFRARNKNKPMKVFAAGVVVVSVFLAGMRFGMGWERYKHHDQYLGHFSRYSVMLRSLAERQELVALTNAIVLFDKKFNPDHDARKLEEAVREILQADPGFQGIERDTNSLP